MVRLASTVGGLSEEIEVQLSDFTNRARTEGRRRSSRLGSSIPLPATMRASWRLAGIRTCWSRNGVIGSAITTWDRRENRIRPTSGSVGNGPNAAEVHNEQTFRHAVHLLSPPHLYEQTSVIAVTNLD